MVFSSNCITSAPTNKKTRERSVNSPAFSWICSLFSVQTCLLARVAKSRIPTIPPGFPKPMKPFLSEPSSPVRSVSVLRIVVMQEINSSHFESNSWGKYINCLDLFWSNVQIYHTFNRAFVRISDNLSHHAGGRLTHIGPKKTGRDSARVEWWIPQTLLEDVAYSCPVLTCNFLQSKGDWELF